MSMGENFRMGQIFLVLATIATAVILCCFFDSVSHDDEDF
jgi:hypothetical protein